MILSFLEDNFNRNVKGGRRGERLGAVGSNRRLLRYPGEKSLARGLKQYHEMIKGKGRLLGPL